MLGQDLRDREKNGGDIEKMTKTNIAEKIIETAFEISGVELSEAESLKESGLDSLSLVALVAALEEKFGITFSDDDLQPENLIWLSDLVKITEKNL